MTVKDKSYRFAIRVVKIYKYLIENKKEFVLSKQFLRSGTSIGALIRESEHGESNSDFIHKLSIALKEANETDYWISLLKDTEFLSKTEFESIYIDIQELIKLLVSILKSSKTTK